MDLRLALLELAAQHRLTPEATSRLNALGQFEAEPPHLARTLPFGVAILGAALGGLGIIFWVAANWETLTRAGRFGLLQALIVVLCAGALLRQAARIPLGVLALLAIGGLFAYFGQTYQTGADPWQLFALWAALALPLCLAVRHDALWAPWSLVAMSAISLWIHAHSRQDWSVKEGDLVVHLAGWSMALLLTLAFTPALSRRTGAGLVTLRLTLILASMIVTMTAAIGLFSETVAPQYWLGLAMLGAAAGAFSQPRLLDIFALSAVGLGLNVLLVTGLANLLFDNKPSEPIMPLLLLGLTAAGLLAATVGLIMKLSRKGAQA